MVPVRLDETDPTEDGELRISQLEEFRFPLNSIDPIELEVDPESIDAVL